jgi:hypothetical protein
VTVRCLSAGLCRSAATVLGDFPNALAYPVDYEQQDHGAMGERAMNVPGMGKRLSCLSAWKGTDRNDLIPEHSFHLTGVVSHNRMTIL